MLRDIYKIVSANRLFFIPFVSFVFFCSIILLLFNKDSIHIAINQENNPSADVFFKYMTYLGDGRTIALLVVLMLFIKYRFALIILLSNALASAAAQLLKIYVFSDNLRPKKYFENIYELYLVKDVDIYSFNSMPSGHTTTAFCAFAGLTLFSKNKNYGLLFFVIAILVAFSRVYLSQHFLEDVFWGSILGVFFALLIYNIFDKKVNSLALEGALFKKKK